MRKYAILFLVFGLGFGACKKCVECEIKLKQSQEVIGRVDEYCGKNKDIESEQERLNSEHNCIKCTVNTGFGPTTSDVLCGNRAYTDSVETSWRDGAASLGTTANCIYYRDTVNVTCVLK